MCILRCSLCIEPDVATRFASLPVCTLIYIRWATYLPTYLPTLFILERAVYIRKAQLVCSIVSIMPVVFHMETRIAQKIRTLTLPLQKPASYIALIQPSPQYMHLSFHTHHLTTPSSPYPANSHHPPNAHRATPHLSNST